MDIRNLRRIHSKDGTANMIRILSKQRKGFNICHINGQSLSNKMDEFRYIFENSNIDLICVSETWFDSETNNPLISLNGYKVLRVDRKEYAGGVAIYVKNGIQFNTLCNSEVSDKIEYLFIEVKSDCRKLLVGTVYRPDKRINFEPFMKVLEDISVTFDDVIIVGDFNCNILIDSSFTTNMNCLGLFPTNTTNPTHFTKTSSTLLDIFFVSNYSNVLLYDQLSAPCFSKHDMIFMNYDFKLHIPDQLISFRDFKNIDYYFLQEEFNKIDWNCIYYTLSIDDQLSYLEQNLQNLFDQTVPLRKKVVSQKDRPWFSSNIKCAINRRDLAYSRWKRFKTTQLHNEYRFERNTTNKLIRDAKSLFYANKFSTAIGSKKTWQTIREIGIGKDDKNEVSSIDADLINEKFVNIPMVHADQNFYNNYSNSINNQFNFIGVSQTDVYNSCHSIKSNAAGDDEIHPKFLKILLPQLLPIITHIFNKIIASSCYPSKWKKAKIIPIPKSNSDYRPIAILPFLSKAFERLLHNQMSLFLDNNNLITDRQSGFRKKHSCLTALIDVVEDLRKDIDERKVTFLVLLDHSKAFDTVDHKILCYKLRNMFNFSSTSTRLMSSYLENRSQYVHTNTRNSNCLSLQRGVPQGSIVGPLLFSLYANDLPNQLQKFKVRMYADDVQLYASCKVTSINECIQTLNQELERVFIWATANGLSINPQKSKCIVIKKKLLETGPIPNIHLNNQQINTVDHVKNLGIMFNTTLTWTNHINYACGRTYSMLRTLWKTQHCTPVKIRMLLAKTYLLPTLLYGCELFASCDSISSSKLNVLFNNIARYVFDLKNHGPVSSFSKQIYGITFDNFLKTRVLIFLHKIIYNEQPDHLFKRLCFSRSNRGKRIISFKQQSLMSEWQFFVNAVRLWNSIPHNAQIINNAQNFKKNIFEHFSH